MTNKPTDLGELFKQEEEAALIRARAEIAKEATDPIFIAKHKKRMEEFAAMPDAPEETETDEDEDEEND